MKKLKTDELNRLTLDEFKKQDKNKVLVVLDNVRSLNNVGSAFRTSDAFNVEKIFLCGITGKPPHRDIHKTALGATDSVTWEYEESTLELVHKLKLEGYVIVAIEQADDSMFLNDFIVQKEGKYCFIFGNEVFGVDDNVMQEIDMCLEVPQWGTKHSLNVSVTIGVVLWDYVSKLASSR